MKRLLRRHRRKIALGGAISAVSLFLLWLVAPWLAPSLAERSRRVPSIVWSRPAMLDPRLPITRDEVRAMLSRRGYVETSSKDLVEGRYRVEGASLVVRRRAFATGDLSVPADTLTLFFDGRRLSSIVDGRGNPIARADLEPEVLGRFYGEYWHDRMPVTLDELPEHLVGTLIEIEDRRFYRHSGVDLWRIGGAALANLRAGRTVQGGSTITQQLVKNLWLSSEKRLVRKAKEAVLAYLLERRYSKKEILETYLNEVYLGQTGPIAIHGVGQAAHHYFGKSPRDLTLAESAFLVGLVQAPGKHSPHAHPKAALARRDLVLDVLAERGKIGDDEHARAIAEPLKVRPAPRWEQPAPFVTAWVGRALEPRYDAVELAKEGLDVHTTIDARLQRLANAAVEKHLSALESRRPALKRPANPLQAAVVVLTPHSGEILALVGGRDWRQSQFDRATQARRQPGSTFKPIVALAALTDTREPRVTLASHLEDEPLEMKTKDGTWRPVNWDHQFRGTVTLRETLETSLNVPIVRLGQKIGADRLVETARRLGIESPLEPVPSLALGSSGVTLLELTQAYAVFASEGLLAKPTAINAVRDARGRLVSYHGRDVEARFLPAETFLVTSALEGATEHGTGKSVRDLGWTGPLAGKTGTSDRARDLWFVAYTPDLVVGVWVGYDDGTPTGLTSSSAALPIAADLLLAALGPEYDQAIPPPLGVERVTIHRESGLRAGIGCGGDGEWFLEGTAPEERCEAKAWRPVRSLLDALGL